MRPRWTVRGCSDPCLACECEMVEIRETADHMAAEIHRAVEAMRKQMHTVARAIDAVFVMAGPMAHVLTEIDLDLMVADEEETAFSAFRETFA